MESRIYAGRDGYRTVHKKRIPCPHLEVAGMEVEEVYYPYPDYKFPMEIYSDAYLPKKGELNDNAEKCRQRPLCPLSGDSGIQYADRGGTVPGIF